MRVVCFNTVTVVLICFGILESVQRHARTSDGVLVGAVETVNGVEYD